jgi:hypothetical protein
MFSSITYRIVPVLFVNDVQLAFVESSDFFSRQRKAEHVPIVLMHPFMHCLKEQKVELWSHLRCCYISVPSNQFL